MKGERKSRFFLCLAFFAILVRNVPCRLHFETSTEILCCERLHNANDFRCWNKTREMGNTTNTTTVGQCVREMSRKTCFNVTAVAPCRDNTTEKIVAPGKREIHIGAFVPFLKDDRYGHFTAMKMAIDLINNRTDVLENYTLVLDAEDTAWVSELF